MKVLVLASAISCAWANDACSTKWEAYTTSPTSGKFTCGVNTVYKSANTCTGTCADDATDRAACCKAKAKCSTQFGAQGSSATTKCAVGKYVKGTTYCADTTCSATTDLSACCTAQDTCNNKFEDAPGTSTTKTDCLADEKAQGSLTYCKEDSCTDANDKATCCPKKQLCSAGFEISTGTLATKVNCATKDYVVHTTARCADKTCKSTDDATCCVPLCADVFIMSGTAASGQIKCSSKRGSSDYEVSDTAHCKGSTCTSVDDDATCCVKKTTTTASGNNSSNKSSDARSRFATTSLVSTVVGGVVMMLS